MGISSLTGRTGMFLMAAILAITVSACGSTAPTTSATSAKPTLTVTVSVPPLPSLEEGIRELEGMKFGNPRINPNLADAKNYPWVAEAGSCTLEFTKFNKWSSFERVPNSDTVIVVTDVSIEKLGGLAPYEHCFPPRPAGSPPLQYT
jgi:hypothetical protein